MTHYSDLKKEYFDQIKNGSKIYELRCNDEKRRQIKVNDLWIFSFEGNKIMTKVIEIKHFANIRDAIENTELKFLLPLAMTSGIPDAKDINDAVKIYENFNGYKEKQINGMIRFKLLYYI